ncbi:trypco2 family protein [Frankia sp. CiP3]|uniref:trypco2 family protein n=1 Tax=Frankia sp. CiP3 TaxID=2880971 RepID=UPI001EF4F137|nr:trypco2 family protein [Frankia sp. CiP3]
MRRFRDVPHEQGVEMADEPWVELSDAIGAVRRELATARLAGAGEPVRFGLGPVELEFALEVTQNGQGEAGVRLGVVTLGGKGGRSSGTTHRLTVTLHPLDSAGGPLEVADED